MKGNVAYMEVLHWDISAYSSAYFAPSRDEPLKSTIPRDAWCSVLNCNTFINTALEKKILDSWQDVRKIQVSAVLVLTFLRSRAQ